MGSLRTRERFSIRFGDPEPSEHVKFLGLLESFSGAFQSRALSLDLDIDILERGGDSYQCDGPECKICANICATFPLKVVMTLHCRNTKYVTDVCLSQDEFCTIIAKRTTIAMVPSLAADRFRDVVYGAVSSRQLEVEWYDEISESKAMAEKEFYQRMGELGAFGERDYIYYITPQNFQQIQAMIDFGCTARQMSNDDLNDALEVSKSYPNIWLKPSIDRLARMGFALDRNDFVIVDPSDYPVLREYDWQTNDE